MTSQKEPEVDWKAYGAWHPGRGMASPYESPAKAPSAAKLWNDLVKYYRPNRFRLDHHPLVPDGPDDETLEDGLARLGGLSPSVRESFSEDAALWARTRDVFSKKGKSGLAGAQDVEVQGIALHVPYEDARTPYWQRIVRFWVRVGGAFAVRCFLESLRWRVGSRRRGRAWATCFRREDHPTPVPRAAERLRYIRLVMAQLDEAEYRLAVDAARASWDTLSLSAKIQLVYVLPTQTDWVDELFEEMIREDHPMRVDTGAHARLHLELLSWSLHTEEQFRRWPADRSTVAAAAVNRLGHRAAPTLMAMGEVAMIQLIVSHEVADYLRDRGEAQRYLKAHPELAQDAAPLGPPGAPGSRVHWDRVTLPIRVRGGKAGRIPPERTLSMCWSLAREQFSKPRAPSVDFPREEVALGELFEADEMPHFPPPLDAMAVAIAPALLGAMVQRDPAWAVAVAFAPPYALYTDKGLTKGDQYTDRRRTREELRAALYHLTDEQYAVALSAADGIRGSCDPSHVAHVFPDQQGWMADAGVPVPQSLDVALLRRCRLAFDAPSILINFGVDSIPIFARYRSRRLERAFKETVQAVESAGAARLLAALVDRGVATPEEAIAYARSFPEVAIPSFVDSAWSKPGHSLLPGLSVALRQHPEWAAHLSDEQRSRVEGLLPTSAPVVAGPEFFESSSDAWKKGDPNHLPRLKALPDWLDVALLSRISVGDGVLSDAATRRALEMCSVLFARSSRTNPATFPALAELSKQSTRSSLAEFAWSVTTLWLHRDGKAKTDWCLRLLAHFGDDAVVHRLAPLVRRWPTENNTARAQVGVDVLAAIGTPYAMSQLYQFSQSVPQRSLRTKASAAVDRLATEMGLSAEDLGDRLVPDLGLDPRGRMVLDYGARTFEVRFDERLRPSIISLDSGARIKALPKPNKDDDAALAREAKQAWKKLAADVKRLGRSEAKRLERSMIDGRRWVVDDFKHYLVDHPLLISLTRRLIWGVYRGDSLIGTFRVFEDRALANAEDEPAPWPEDEIGLVHPSEMDERLRATWAERLAEDELTQPFEQLARSVVRRPSPPVSVIELDQRVPHGQFRALLRKGWEPGPEVGAGVVRSVVRRLADDTTVTLEFEPGIAIGGGEQREQVVRWLRFRPSTEEVPEREYSELMRELAWLETAD